MHIATRLLTLLTTLGLLSTFGGAGAFSAVPVNAAQARTLYHATWASGMAGWQVGGTGSWTTDGAALRGSASSDTGGSTLIAPFLGRTGTYSVTARMRLVAWTGAYTNEFGIVIRSNGPQNPKDPATFGLVGGVVQLALDLGSEAAIYTLGGDGQRIFPKIADVTSPNAWHTVTVQVRGTNVTMLIDGVEVTHVTSKLSLAGKKVGLFVSGAQVRVKTFTVLSR